MARAGSRVGEWAVKEIRRGRTWWAGNVGQRSRKGEGGLAFVLLSCVMVTLGLRA
jgi:hypothetical protein